MFLQRSGFCEKASLPSKSTLTLLSKIASVLYKCFKDGEKKMLCKENVNVIYLSCASKRNLITHSGTMDNMKEQSRNGTRDTWTWNETILSHDSYFGSCVTLMLQALFGDFLSKVGHRTVTKRSIHVSWVWSSFCILYWHAISQAFWKNSYN